MDAYSATCDPQSKVFMCGYFRGTDVSFPRFIHSLLGIQVTGVSCGDEHACVLASDGRIFAWGIGRYGRLGLGDETDRTTPQLVPYTVLVPMTQVACGFALTTSISRDGKAYSWGAGMNGRLGHGNELSYFVPMKLSALDDHKVTRKSSPTLNLR